VNCAAIPETLLESELFGHERGAFTDARTQKLGLIELAGSGTLFLDEIHHMPYSLQPKLLRVLEERKIRRLGGLEEFKIKCRLIAATNVRLEDAVARQEFREDLFYRLNVFRITLPTLRERPEDIEPLARYFLEMFAREHSRKPKELSREALDALREHFWPGNIRELKNVIERAAILAGSAALVRVEHLMVQQRTARPARSNGTNTAGEIHIPLSGRSLADIEREAVRITLQLTRGNQSEAARLLGISRPTLARKIREAELGSTGGQEPS
jgi:transcriptional regulator with PAS, ATPase and Fis domain